MGNHERGGSTALPVTQRIYGGSYYGFFMDHKMPNFSKTKWKQVVQGFFRKYKGLAAWHRKTLSTVINSNGEFTIPTGRRFKFHRTLWKDGIKDYNERQVKNYPVQGLSGGDILPLAAVVIRRGLRKAGMKSRMILTVHDSLVFDAPKDELHRLAKLCTLVGNNLATHVSRYFDIDWNVKLEGEIEYGPNYAELKEYKGEF